MDILFIANLCSPSLPPPLNASALEGFNCGAKERGNASRRPPSLPLPRNRRGKGGVGVDAPANKQLFPCFAPATALGRVSSLPLPAPGSFFSIALLR